MFDSFSRHFVAPCIPGQWVGKRISLFKIVLVDVRVAPSVSVEDVKSILVLQKCLLYLILSLFVLSAHLNSIGLWELLIQPSLTIRKHGLIIWMVCICI